MWINIDVQPLGDQVRQPGFKRQRLAADPWRCFCFATSDQPAARSVAQCSAEICSGPKNCRGELSPSQSEVMLGGRGPCSEEHTDMAISVG